MYRFDLKKTERCFVCAGKVSMKICALCSNHSPFLFLVLLHNGLKVCFLCIFSCFCNFMYSNFCSWSCDPGFSDVILVFWDILELDSCWFYGYAMKDRSKLEKPPFDFSAQVCLVTSQCCFDLFLDLVKLWAYLICLTNNLKQFCSCPSIGISCWLSCYGSHVLSFD